MSSQADPLAGFAALEGQPGRRWRYVLVDVFTDEPLAGNPLAVFLDAAGLASQDMQRLARELNLSETAFVQAGDGGAELPVRIFTPTTELPFAGHPVLGTAIVAAAALGRESVTLRTGSGPVPVRISGRSPRGGSGWMEQPLPTWRTYERSAELLAALGLERSGLPVELYDNGPRHVLVELPAPAQVAALRVDMRALAELGELCVSCFAGSDASWKTRMFAPGLGVAEDPATGSAAGPLAVHLSRHGRIAFGAEIEIAQGEELGRPSRLFARARGSAARLAGVEVGGSAVIVAEGEFLLD